VKIDLADSEPEIKELSNPKDELERKIVTLAGTIRKWNMEYGRVRKTVKKQLEEIRNLGLNKYNMEKTDLRKLVVKIFQIHGVSDSWIRKLLPPELKDPSKTRISYLQRQEIEKERQQLLQQQASESQIEYRHSDGCKVESVSYQPSELELTLPSSEVRQGLETQYAFGNDSLDHKVLSPSKGSVIIQNELNEAYKKIEKLEADVWRLSEQFVARASLQALSETVLVVAHIDPVKKAITSIQTDNATSI
jgi:hypothetical protein